MNPICQINRLGIISLLLLSFPSPSNAQIIPDATLPNNTIVTPQGTTLQIEGGTRAGSNLFHSFREFSVRAGSDAFFNNASDIQNILTRVTGEKISNIDGLIRANGTANLFLINPNGIIFGPNASLNIGGSFLGSTAHSIKFADGSTFDAINPNAPPLLTINIPIGLQFGANPGSIVNQSRTTLPTLSQPIGLAVQPGKTLALVGGNITLESGNLTASGGRIELGSIRQGTVSINPISTGFALGYEGVDNFQDIQLSGGASVDTSGVGGGNISINSRRISLTENSRFLALTLGEQAGGAIAVNAAESVEITGTGGYDQNVLAFVTGNVTDANLRNGFFTSSFGTGSAGNIEMDTGSLIARNGAYVATSTFTAGKGGDLTVNASKSVDLQASFLATGTNGNAGDAGTLTLNTGNFVARANAVLTTSTIGLGRGGDLNVNADRIELIGNNPIQVTPTARVFTAFFSSTLGTGRAGNLNVSVRELIIRDGAGLAASAFSQGDGGNITINATESVELTGNSPNGAIVSSITAVTEPGSTGKGGNITVNTDKLTLQDGGRFSVRSRGTGSTGNLEIVANAIRMDNQGGLEGTAVSGEGANILVRSPDVQMRRNSFISATAGTEGGPGNGGNITINTETLTALENSDIIANAFQGRGGNISINTQGIFLSPDSEITASSQRGIAGVVEINQPDIELSKGLVDLPEKFTDPTTQIVSGCAASVGNEFVITGRGGLPSDPTQTLRGRSVWRDVRFVGTGDGGLGTGQSLIPNPHAPYPQRGPHPAPYPQRGPLPSPIPNLQSPIVEATGWTINAAGKVELLAAATNIMPSLSWYQSPQCGN